ncbi:MAG: nuclear transport factor 2 family protein [Actinomycetota bacterium]
MSIAATPKRRCSGSTPESRPSPGWHSGQGTFRGKDGVLKLMANFWQSFDHPRSEIEECVGAGDHVVIAVRYFGRGKTSGVEVDTHGAQVVTFRDGKVVRWRIFQAMAEALEAARLRE